MISYHYAYWCYISWSVFIRVTIVTMLPYPVIILIHFFILLCSYLIIMFSNVFIILSQPQSHCIMILHHNTYNRHYNLLSYHPMWFQWSVLRLTIAVRIPDINTNWFNRCLLLISLFFSVPQSHCIMILHHYTYSCYYNLLSYHPMWFQWSVLRFTIAVKIPDINTN